MSIKLSTLAPFIVPGQPTNFQVGEVSDTSVQLTWEPAFEKEGIISYELHYKEGSQGPQVPSQQQTFSNILSGHIRFRSNCYYFPPNRKRNNSVRPLPMWWRAYVLIQSTTSLWLPSPTRALGPSPMKYPKGHPKPVCSPFPFLRMRMKGWGGLMLYNAKT